MTKVPWSYRRLWASGRKRVARFRAGASDFDHIWPRSELARRWDPDAYNGSLARRAVDKVFADYMRELAEDGGDR